MTIAVTGATGHLGTLVIEALIAKGVEPGEVVALARDLQKATTLAEKGVAVRHFDYTQPETLARELDDVTRLLLISGTAFGQRFAQHSAVIDAAKQAGVQRVVYTSVDTASTNVADSLNPVSPEHAQTEEYLAASGLDHVILRNNWYHENYLGQLDTAPASATVLTSAGDGRVASAARADYAEAAAVVLTSDSPKPLYRLTGDVAWGFDELAADLSEVLGTTISASQVSGEEQAAALKGAGLDDGTIGFVVGVDAAIAAGELGDATPELSTLLGRLTTPLIDVLRQSSND